MVALCRPCRYLWIPKCSWKVLCCRDHMVLSTLTCSSILLSCLCTYTLEIFRTLARLTYHTEMRSGRLWAISSIFSEFPCPRLISQLQTRTPGSNSLFFLLFRFYLTALSALCTSVLLLFRRAFFSIQFCCVDHSNAFELEKSCNRALSAMYLHHSLLPCFVVWIWHHSKQIWLSASRHYACGRVRSWLIVPASCLLCLDISLLCLQIAH